MKHNLEGIQNHFESLERLKIVSRRLIGQHVPTLLHNNRVQAELTSAVMTNTFESPTHFTTNNTKL